MAVSGSKKPKNRKRNTGGCKSARSIYNFTRRIVEKRRTRDLGTNSCNGCENNVTGSESTGMCCLIHGYKQAPIIDCKDFYPKQ